MNIIDDLKTENNFAFGKIYENNFHKISKFVLNNNGTHTDAEDLFQDAMMVLIEKLRQDNFQLTASINTYVYAICKNLWLKKLRNKRYDFSLEDIQSYEFMISIEQAIDREKSFVDKLKGYLTKITSHCNKLIHDIFFNEKPIDQIQKDYGYKTRHSAQNQKHKCVEQIRRVKEKEEKLKKGSVVG